MARLIFDRVPADSPDERWYSANIISSHILSYCENKRGNRKLFFSCPYFSPLLGPFFPLLFLLILCTCRDIPGDISRVLPT